MAAYLVYRSKLTDQHKIGMDIGGFLVNGADSTAALAAAVAKAIQLTGPNNGNEVNFWTVVQLSASDMTTANLSGLTIQGQIVPPGGHLIGGGILV